MCTYPLSLSKYSFFVRKKKKKKKRLPYFLVSFVCDKYKTLIYLLIM